MPKNRTLFISYRRDDSAGWAGRLEVDLRSRLGTDLQVFMDVDSIPAGEDFARAIDDAVRRSDALVALIGPGWITAQDAQGRRRLDNPDDFVRVELESALRRDIRVIPALVGGASLPREDTLPETLRDLTKRQAVKLDNETWNPGLDRLIRAIEPPPDTRAPPRLTLSTDRIDFGVLALHADWPRRTVQVRNAGGGELNAAATTTESWIALRNREAAVDILVDTSDPGEYFGLVTVSSAGGTASIGISAVVESRSVLRPRPPTWFAQLIQRSVGHRTVIAAGTALAVFAALAVAIVLLQGGESPRRPEATTTDGAESNDYPRYTRVRDDTGQLSFLAPSDWGNVYGNGWHPKGVPPYDDKRIGPGVNAAPNVAAWMEDVTTPGIFVGASSAVTARYDPKRLAERIGPANSKCKAGRQDDFQTSYPITLTGIQQRSSCSGGAEWDTIAAWPEDHRYLVYLQIKLVTPRDHVARERLLSSLLIRGAK